MSFKSIKFIAVLTLLIGAFSCTSDSLEDPITTTEPPAEPVLWTGTPITFTKAAGADPSLPENQDRISNAVWITRANDGGQIFNAKSESQAASGSSPSGTRWAVGTIDEVDNLEFKTFRAAVDKPKSVVGKSLVMQLTEENVFIEVKFTSWSTQKQGGFSYERSTAN